MSLPKVRLSMRLLHVTLGVAVISTSVAGCTAPVNTATDATAEPTTRPSAAASQAPVSDEESCQAFGDVSTILHNATVALHEERMTQQEYDGWMRLATRVLDRVPTSGVGAVSDAITELQDAAPAVPAGTTTRATDIVEVVYSDTVPLADACNAAGVELGAEAFIGG